MKTSLPVRVRMQLSDFAYKGQILSFFTFQRWCAGGWCIHQVEQSDVHVTFFRGQILLPRKRKLRLGIIASLVTLVSSCPSFLPLPHPLLPRQLVYIITARLLKTSGRVLYLGVIQKQTQALGENLEKGTCSQPPVRTSKSTKSFPWVQEFLQRKSFTVQTTDVLNLISLLMLCGLPQCYKLLKHISTYYFTKQDWHILQKPWH